MKELLVAAAGDGSAVPGAVACVQTYGNLLDWKLFRHKVLRMLQDEDAVDDAVVASMLAWHHTGFGPHVGAEIAAADGRGRENVARYLCHPPVALGRIMAQDSAARGVAPPAGRT
ncbi:MAG: hypothetical protein IT452_00640 [Planctomycetia bacterium]|nr:hypothetical protein [Planctomycetia bacterium]